MVEKINEPTPLAQVESFDLHWRWHWKAGKIQKTGEGISNEREQSGKNKYGWQKFKGSGTGRASLSKIAATSHLWLLNSELLTSPNRTVLYM